MLVISHPPTYEAERLYIYDVLLKEFLGLEYVTKSHQSIDVRFTVEGESIERALVVPDILFQTPADRWLTAASLPISPLDDWDVASASMDALALPDRIPVLYGRRLQNGSFFIRSQAGIDLGIDIFGSAFFMLTRYEEVVKQDRDNQDRFPARASIAYQEGFLNQPIVNIYLELLWLALKELWPGLKRKQRAFQVYLSHDVDWPFFFVGKNLLQACRLIVGSSLKQKSLPISIQYTKSLKGVLQGDVGADIFNTFDSIMDLSEHHCLKSAFNFITVRRSEIDGNHLIDNPWIRDLMKRIHERGHEIGLHPGYGSFRDPSQIQEGFEVLRSVCAKESIDQEIWGGRQHYLRWEAPATWQHWEDAGLDYDSTLVFADHVGFRCGTCYEYPVFNLISRRTLHLWERPLIFMESTVLDKHYMGLSYDDAWQTISSLKHQCEIFNGDFTLLWHNSRLVDKSEIDLYRCAVAGM